MANRAGSFRSNLSGEAAYSSFLPSPLPPDPPIRLDEEGIRLLAQARADVAELSSAASRVPSVSLFQSMYVRKEALLSSQIEGTQATLEDILDPELDTNANLDAADVVNYVKAMDYSLELIKRLPLCNRFIREIHAVLMQGVRGQEKTPGEFRRSQNWIGGASSTLTTARYIPPNIDDMTQAMGDLEIFMNDQSLDPLVSAALLHYQFETIHPFLDGNGRLGRLLIIVYLISRGLLPSPVMYISLFLKANRVEYFDRMTAVRQTGDYEQWVSFFLRAVSVCARDSLNAIDDLTALHDANLVRISALGRASATAVRLFAYCETHPIIDIPTTATALGVTYSTTDSAVQRLVGLGILDQATPNRRNRLFSYTAYLDILRQGT